MIKLLKIIVGAVLAYLLYVAASIGFLVLMVWLLK